MPFIQIIDMKTDQYEAIDALDRDWERETEGRRTVRRSIVCRDRNDPEHYMILVFFDSYESAMENSALPETATLAEKMGGLLSTPPAFHDLEVVDDRT